MDVIVKLFNKILIWGAICFAAVIILSKTQIHLKVLYPRLYQPIVEKYSQQYQLDPNLVYAVIRVESHFKADVVSPKNAVGLMQITESTGDWAAKQIGLKSYKKEMLQDPDTNIRIGCWYLRKLDNQFDHNRKLVLAAYNAGSGNVRKWLNNREYSKTGIHLDKIPFVETRVYVYKVMTDFRRYQQFYDN